MRCTIGVYRARRQCPSLLVMGCSSRETSRQPSFCTNISIQWCCTLINCFYCQFGRCILSTHCSAMLHPSSLLNMTPYTAPDAACPTRPQS